MSEVQRARVLILAERDEIGALMAALVELSGYEPVLPLGDESHVEAVRRVAAPLVLLEFDHDIGGSPPLDAAVRDAGSVALLFSPARSAEELEQIARRCGLEAVTFPLDRQRFGEALRRALAATSRS